MANKKEVTHESLMAVIVDAENVLKQAKEEYQKHCVDFPLELPKQPTLHELRLMRDKNDKATLADHQKANEAAQSSAQKEQLKQELKG